MRGARVPRVLWHLVVGTVVLVALFTAAGLVAILVARPTGSLGTFSAVQTVLGLMLLTYAVHWRTVVGLRGGIPAVPLAFVPGAVAYVALPSSWQGTTLFAWQFVPPGAVTFAVDLLAWGAAVALGVLWGTAQQELRVDPSTPYG